MPSDPVAETTLAVEIAARRAEARKLHRQALLAIVAWGVVTPLVLPAIFLLFDAAYRNLGWGSLAIFLAWAIWAVLMARRA